MTTAMDRWSALADQLTDLEHRLWRATPPEACRPLGRPVPEELRLELTVAERQALERQIAAVRLELAQMAVADLEQRFGRAPAWAYEHIARCRPQFGLLHGGLQP